MNTPNARDRILKAAVKIFAQKSFEGSRIQEISEEANVPKSLIYYHFKSKTEILEVLTQEFIDEYLKIIDSSLGESHKEKAKKLPNRMKNVYYEFGQKHADLIRVIFIESLKNTKEPPVFYQLIKAMIEKEKNCRPSKNYDVQERRIAEFFTSFIPNLAYICFAESWTKYFDINRTDFDKAFLRIYDETHGAYHRNN